MKEESHNRSIDPELEARIVALVLGEASDFESDELNRLIAQRPELAALMAEMQSVHGLLGDVGAGEAVAEDEDWKLSADKRDDVLAVIHGELPEQPTKQLAPKAPDQRMTRRRKLLTNIASIAALFCVAGFFAMKVMPRQYARSVATTKQLGLATHNYHASVSMDIDGEYLGDHPSLLGGTRLRYQVDAGGAVSDVDQPHESTWTDLDGKSSKSALSAIRETLDVDGRLPNPYYLQDDVQYFPATPEFETAGEAGARHEIGAVEGFDRPTTATANAAKPAPPTAVDPAHIADYESSWAIPRYRDSNRPADSQSAAPKTNAPKTNAPKTDAKKAPATPSPAPVSDENANGVIDETQIEFVPELGRVVVRGNRRAVERAKSLVDELSAKDTSQSSGQDTREARPADESVESEESASQGELSFPMFAQTAPRSTVAVPDGGTVLRGGIRRNFSNDRKSSQADRYERDGERNASRTIGGQGFSDDYATSKSMRGEVGNRLAVPAVPDMQDLLEGEVADSKRPDNAYGGGSVGGAHVLMGDGAGIVLSDELEQGIPSVPQPEEITLEEIDSISTVDRRERKALAEDVVSGGGPTIKSEDLVEPLTRRINPSGTQEILVLPNEANSTELWDVEFDDQTKKLRFDDSGHKQLRQTLKPDSAQVASSKPSPINEPANSKGYSTRPQDHELFLKGKIVMPSFLRGDAPTPSIQNPEPYVTGSGKPGNEDFSVAKQDGEWIYKPPAKNPKLSTATEREGDSRHADQNAERYWERRDVEKRDSNVELRKTRRPIDELAAQGQDKWNAYVPPMLEDRFEEKKKYQSHSTSEPWAARINRAWLDKLPPPVKRMAAPAGINEKTAEEESFSTFSLHVSDVSFKLAQAALAQGGWPEAAKIRIEEFVNAFDYGDPMPCHGEKVACSVEQSIHPFLQQRNLLRVSMRTAAAGRASNTPLRLTFLLDNSGSMERIDRQQTVRRAFALLAQQLKPIDQVTLISFARQPRLLAEKVSGAQSGQLVELINQLPSEGGTNIEAALQLAFEKAQEQQADNAQNRIILLTDGAVNLGDANPDSLSQMVTTMRDAGIAFDAAGISAEGLNDEILEALTRKGDGRYYLLDSLEAADDGFARQIAGALRPSAKNVKVQIEFNPKRVGRYKLLGFEKHRLKKEDFRNDNVDAAEMSAAEAGVAVYQFEVKPDGEGDVGSVSVRFRDLSSGQMIENRWPIPYEADAPRLDQAAPSLRIATSAALLAAKLRGEPLGESVDLQTLSNLISGLPERDRNAKRVGQLQLMIEQARQVSGK